MVSKGVQEVLDAMQPKEITPEQLMSNYASLSRTEVYKVVFREEHTVKPRDPQAIFNLQHYYANHNLYESNTAQYLPRLTLALNCIYWQVGQPRIMSRIDMQRAMMREGILRLPIIGDISCDIEGGIEGTLKATTIPNPFMVYNPLTHKVVDGVEGPGFIIYSVDHAPTELPLDASLGFSTQLYPWLRQVFAIQAKPGSETWFNALPVPVRRGVLMLRGRLFNAAAESQALRQALAF